jgi:predicted porin
MTHSLPSLSRLAAAVALTILTLDASAQSEVAMYGLIDVSVGRTQAPGGVATKGVESGKMTTSYFGFKGSEDLGGGTNAIYTIESFMRNDTGGSGRFTGDAMWARNAYVGLVGTYGSVTLGRNTTSLFVNTLLFNAIGDAFGYSPAIQHYFTSGTTTGDTGWNDSIKVTSPRWGGATFTAHLALAEANGGRNSGLSGLYFAGDLGLAGAWQKVEKGAAVADTTTWQLGASYDLKAAKLFAQYGQVDNTTTNFDYKITGLGASVPVGPQGKVLAQWGRISPSVGASRSTFTAGYDYLLSKRTDLYAMYMSDRVSGLANGSNYGVGIRHRF